jgi:hypothetical protein
MSVPNPQEVLKLAADMVEAQNVLTSLQIKWASLFNGSSPPAPIEIRPSERKGGRKPDPDGTTSRVLKAIEDSPNEHFDSELLHRKLGIERKKIERALYNLYTAEKIEKHSRGNYEAKTQPGESL